MVISTAAIWLNPIRGGCYLRMCITMKRRHRALRLILVVLSVLLSVLGANAMAQFCPEEYGENRGGVAGNNDETVPQKACRIDGCTLSPDFDFVQCCNEHDLSYWRGGSVQMRKQADEVFRQCIADQGHPFLSVLYYYGVRVGGASFLPTPWRWGFGWQYPNYRGDE